MVERRAAERLQVQAVVDLSVGYRSERVVAYDLSTDGCMIEASAGLLQAGASIALTFSNGISASGRVVWTKHLNAGVQFAERMPLSAVSRIAKDCARPSQPEKISAQTAGASWNPSARGYSFDQLLAKPSSPTGRRDYSTAISPLAHQKITSIFQNAVSLGLIAYCAVLLLHG